MAVSCTLILNAMVLTGCVISFILRINMAIAVVVMPDIKLYEEAVANMSNFNQTGLQELKETDFTFNQWQRNMILGVFYWGYIITELPGGRLAETIGPRIVIGGSMAAASLLNLLTPLCAQLIGYYGLLVVRCLEGLALGSVFPSLYPLAAKWIPPAERSKFMSHLLALSLGAGITYPLCSVLISLMGWKSVFYFTGLLGFAWTTLWFMLVFDSPKQHPRIKTKERLSIESHTGIAPAIKGRRTPWLQLVISGPVWAVILTHTANVFCYSTLSIQTPAFISQVFQVEINQNGLYSSLPHIGKYLVGLLTGYITSYLISQKQLPLILLRKCFAFISLALPGFCMLLQATMGDKLGWSMANLVVALTFNGAVTGGHLCSAVDIAPNYSGTVFGIANTFASIASFMSSVFVGHLTFSMQTFAQWQIVFYTLSFSFFFAFLCFLILGSAHRQEWDPPENNLPLQSEAVPLKT